MREHEQFRSTWNKEEENDQIIINVDHQKEKENKKKKSRGQWKNSRHQPMSRPLPKDRKMEKRKFREFGKKIYFPFYLANKFPEIIQTSRNLPRQYEERDLGISQ